MSLGHTLENASKRGARSRKTVALVATLLLCSGVLVFASEEARAEEEQAVLSTQEGQDLTSAATMAPTVTVEEVAEPLATQTPPVVEALPLEVLSAPVVEPTLTDPVALPEVTLMPSYPASSVAPEPAGPMDAVLSIDAGSLSQISPVLSYWYEPQIGVEVSSGTVSAVPNAMMSPPAPSSSAHLAMSSSDATTVLSDSQEITCNMRVVSSVTVSRSCLAGTKGTKSEESVSSSPGTAALQPEPGYYIPTPVDPPATLPESIGSEKEPVGQNTLILPYTEDAPDLLQTGLQTSVRGTVETVPVVVLQGATDILGPLSKVLQPAATIYSVPSLPVERSVHSIGVAAVRMPLHSGVEVFLTPYNESADTLTESPTSTLSAEEVQETPSPGSMPPPIPLQGAPPLEGSFALSTGGGQAGSGGGTVPLLLLCLLVSSSLILLRPDGTLPLFLRELPKPSSALLLPLERPG